jgi:transposase
LPEAVGLTEQAEQEVLRADVVVLQSPGLLLGEHDRVAGAVSESFEHVVRMRAGVDLVNTLLLVGLQAASKGRSMEWEDRLDDWETELDLSAALEGSDWVTLERAASDTGVSRAALRSWYRSGQIPSRLVEGPHGPQRLVPLAVVSERAEASPRLRHAARRQLAAEAQVEILRHRIEALERRLSAIEARAL